MFCIVCILCMKYKALYFLHNQLTTIITNKYKEHKQKTLNYFWGAFAGARTRSPVCARIPSNPMQHNQTLTNPFLTDNVSETGTLHSANKNQGGALWWHSAMELDDPSNRKSMVAQCNVGEWPLQQEKIMVAQCCVGAYVC